jgi:magnesium chelatase subunit I
MEPDQKQLRQKISKAQRLVSHVEFDPVLLCRVAEICLRLKVDGHRGELTIMRAAKALAAFQGRQIVTESDVRAVALMALRHRLRKDPLEEIDAGTRVLQAVEQIFPIADLPVADCRWRIAD